MSLSGLVKGIALQVVLFMVVCIALAAYLFWSMRPQWSHSVSITNESSQTLEILRIDGVSNSAFGLIKPGESAQRVIGLAEVGDGPIDLRLKHADGTTTTYRVEGPSDSGSRTRCAGDCLHKYTIRGAK